MTSKPARVRAIDWLRGMVMLLMTIDHASGLYNTVEMHGDRAGVPTSPLDPAQFLTRWITHVCAPSFVLLAGASLALSSEKRRDEPGQTAFIVKRGLLIAALDPTWMSLGFVGWQFAVFQVLYAIGLSLVCMAFLRKLSTRTLLIIAFAIQLFGELTTRIPDLPPALDTLLEATFTSGPAKLFGVIPSFFAYPLVPWLSIMMFGWVLGRWIIATRERSGPSRAKPLFGLGLALLAAFIVIRGIDGYGNWGLYRDSLAPLQWLHVAKYPPSLSYVTLELGISFILLALFFLLDDGAPRKLLEPLGLFGATAFFFYLLHAHLLGAAKLLFHINKGGLGRVYLATLAVIVVLYPLCGAYRRYKRAHPDNWTRYI